MGKKSGQDTVADRGDFALRTLNVIEDVSRRINAIRTIQDGLTMITDALRAEFPDQKAVIELYNPLDAQFFGVTITPGVRGPIDVFITHGKISKVMSGPHSDGVSLSFKDLSGDLGDQLLKFGLVDRLDDPHRACICPVIVSGLALGYVVFLVSPEIEDDPTIKSLVTQTASLTGRVSEQLIVSTGMRATESRRQILEERIMKADTQTCSDDDILEYLSTLARPFGPSRRLTEVAGKLGSVADVYRSEVEKLPDDIKPIIQTMRLIERRGKWAQIEKQPLIESWSHLIEYCQNVMGRLKHEEGILLLLDEECRVMELVRMFRGTYDSVHVWPREIVRAALNQGASHVVLVHNHPNGIAAPSPADKQLTIALKEACSTPGLGLEFVDHLIVTQTAHYSFKEAELQTDDPKYLTAANS